MMPLVRDDNTVNPKPSTLAIFPYDVKDVKYLKENVNPSPIDFKIHETLEKRSYRLTGMVMAGHEHYTAISYVPDKKQWYGFDDKKVRAVDQPVWNKLYGYPYVIPVLFFYTLEE